MASDKSNTKAEKSDSGVAKSPIARGKLLHKIIKPLASLKLAVLIIVAIGVITAWGTIVEAQYDANAAKKLVYNSIWMWTPMIALVICLTAVMVDRWPWQKRHTGFVLAHIGIIILLIGSWVTQRFGIDGSINFGIGEKQRAVVVGETDLAVYTSLDGSQYRTIFDREVDFFLRPAQKKPMSIEIPGGVIKIVESLPYALREQKIVESSDPKSGVAIRFQLQNANVNLTEWMLQPSPEGAETKDLGPAQVMIVPNFPRDFGGRNAILFRPVDAEKLEYNIHTARTKSVKSGFIKAGESLRTDWMALELRLLKYMHKAKEEVTYRPVERPTPLTTAAIRVQYQIPGQTGTSEQWMGLNSLLKLFGNSEMYVVSYGNRRLPLGFDMTLKEFRIGRYQGTLRAASYESVVKLPDSSEHLISMNEPLKYAGYTFYQASFDSDETGRPRASILSVNMDPGRGLKYFGSLLLVLGSIHLFYLKRRAWMNVGNKK